jgi:hypothetical protein
MSINLLNMPVYQGTNVVEDTRSLNLLYCIAIGKSQYEIVIQHEL